MQKSSLRVQAEKLRKSGKSYSQIGKILGIPKGTLSYWFKQAKWSKDITANLLRKNYAQNTQRLMALNKAKREHTIARHERFRQEAQKEYDIVKTDRLFIAGLALYWGEGDKVANGRVSVINTDPNMLKLIVSFYRKYLNVPAEKLRAALFLYKDLDKHRLINYWVAATKIPARQFIKTQVLKSRSRLTKRKTEFGICSVYFSDTRSRIKISEWIRLLAAESRT